ncbi:hypothetical protein EP47_13650 [Legionella norrlandica]|uniref:Coiled-coil protein n=1 Tax=Legionella norrlandica TaxID=1498499 RepID=A0A0A2STE2_9GAMM|nr:hypothetical protein [Legionella norrlandica]KGP62729.1 hypothetical protein EP47_13650 [Legionella norrlandica]
MDVEQKKRILKRYLKEKSTTPDHVNLTDEDLASYAALDNLLDYISLHNNELFDFSTLEADDKQWTKFTDILSYSTTFSRGSPPTLTNTNEPKALYGLQYWRNAREIGALPRDNYYARAVTPIVDEDGELNELIIESRGKLYELTQAFPNATPFNPANIIQVNAQITSVKEQMSTLSEDNPQKAVLEKKLNILMDLNKINQLQRLSIPQDNGPPLSYCTLPDAAGGVTEKISLIRLGKVKEQLGHLRAQDALTVDNYNENRGQYKLSTEGMLKLPKHGDIKEVQREAMALNISRLMRLDTTASTTVSYNGHPALFIPFDNISLLNEFSSGKTFKAGIGLSGQTYTHYSTIKPVGEGVQCDRFIHDFGNALALLYVCCDTDAIGGYCKNKALRNDRSLYIFDQVVMDIDKFILDSRISLQPDQFIMKHTRHGQGRNRTLIEDSSLVTKYASLMQLKEVNRIIIQYCDHVSWLHHKRIQTINRSLQGVLTKEERVRLTEELKDVETLQKDAEKIKNKIQIRINKIDEVLPKTTGVISSDEVRQALILEKLLHNPALFSDDGRPYKNPWTTRQNNTVQTINDLRNGNVQITFKANVPIEIIDFIKRHDGGDSITVASPKVITISKAHLNGLREDMLHPEHSLNLSPDTNYLAAEDLNIIQMAYSKEYRARILDIITEYRTIMNNEDTNTPDKLECLSQTEDTLKALIETAKDKGLGMHILKKFYFDAQQQLQKLITPEHLPHNINQAFAAALKLDKVSKFNEVVREAIAYNKVTDPQFTSFLAYCIQREALTTNYREAQRESEALSLEAQRVINHLKNPVVPLIIQLGGQHSEDRLVEVDPIINLENDLRLEHEVLNSVPISSVSISQPVVDEDNLENGITTKVY